MDEGSAHWFKRRASHPSIRSSRPATPNTRRIPYLRYTTQGHGGTALSDAASFWKGERVGRGEKWLAIQRVERFERLIYLNCWIDGSPAPSHAGASFINRAPAKPKERRFSHFSIFIVFLADWIPGAYQVTPSTRVVPCDAVTHTPAMYKP